MKPDIVLVGGGIGSLLSASILAEAGFGVSIIDKEGSLGGLLRSWTSPEAFEFDYGTHILAKTGVSEIDRHLFDFLNWEDWNQLKELKAGNFFAGRLNEISPFIDSRSLGRELHDQGLIELLEANDQTSDDLTSLLKNRFGETFFEKIFRPALEKLYFSEVTDLALDAHELFGLSRVLVGSSRLGEKLKDRSEWDDKIAFHGFRGCDSGSLNFYPKMGGVGSWVLAMTQRLKEQGVRFFLGQQIEELSVHQGRVRNITLKNKNQIPCDHLIWSLPSAFLHYLLRREVSDYAPRFLSTRLFHFVFDSNFETSLYYLNCFDPKFKSFRVTLYPNLQPISSHEKNFRATVEVFDTDLNSKPDWAKIVHEELIAMGVVSGEAQILKSYEQILPNTFPVRTKEFAAANEFLSSQLQAMIRNLSLIGKAQTKVFFMNEVLLDSFAKTKALLDLYGKTPHISQTREVKNFEKNMI